jgi:hypothetical protein
MRIVQLMLPALVLAAATELAKTKPSAAQRYLSA